LRYKLKSKEQRQLTSVKTRRLDIVSIDYSDIPQLCDEFFAEAEEAWPPTKEQLTIRLDADVLTWLKVLTAGAIRRGLTEFCVRQWKAKPREGRVPPQQRPKKNIRPRSKLKSA